MICFYLLLLNTMIRLLCTPVLPCFLCNVSSFFWLLLTSPTNYVHIMSFALLFLFHYLSSRSYSLYINWRISFFPHIPDPQLCGMHLLLTATTCCSCSPCMCKWSCIRSYMWCWSWQQCVFVCRKGPTEIKEDQPKGLQLWLPYLLRSTHHRGSHHIW